MTAAQAGKQHAVLMRRLWSTPSYRAKQRRVHLERWKDPAYHARMVNVHLGKKATVTALRKRARKLALVYRAGMRPAERKVWGILRRLNLRFRSQVPILGGQIADFYLPDHNLVLEVDKQSYSYKVLGTKRLCAAGYRVLRVTNHNVDHNPDQVAVAILQKIGSWNPHEH